MSVIEKTIKTLSVAALAPLLGIWVDWAARDGVTLMTLWPVAVSGIVFSVLGLVIQSRPPERESHQDTKSRRVL